jgi:hypothetical protein
MYTNVNLAAPLGAVALLGSGLLFLITTFALIYALTTRKRRLARLALIALATVGGSYAVALLGFSLASSEQVLSLGNEKHFCEIDCHLAYSITEVRDSKTLGDGAGQLSAAGIFRLVTIKTRFDQETIGRNRGDSLLYPNSRVVSISDANGNEYLPANAAHDLLEATHAAGTPMTIPLRPGESYSTTLVFDLPANINNPTLFLREGETLTHLVIGHENSPLHKKVRFSL